MPQVNQENCVAHNGSLVPVPGRDIMVQAWYQGGISAFDFTDSANPKEIAFFDRGPVSATSLLTGGAWSSYYYNGHVYSSEIARGFDVLALTPSAHLDKAELDAAALVRFDTFNPQSQPKITWAPSFEIVRAYYAQALRAGTMEEDTAANVQKFVDRAERFKDGPQKKAAVAQLRAVSNQLDAADSAQAALIKALRDLADALG
ncbi:hypothetical protein [Streptosporangium sp. CA-115845]|uniref:hypothetical protein n=1 Tax=Streptosporangium sp. CA-115845 TaxID=3240071 RepID=UPI003D9331CC